jgi:hypothetical protein
MAERIRGRMSESKANPLLHHAWKAGMPLTACPRCVAVMRRFRPSNATRFETHRQTVDMCARRTHPTLDNCSLRR